MKSFDECLKWMADVIAYKSSAPEGVYMAKKDMVTTLREVDPAVIVALNTHFSTTETAPGVKWVCKLEGDKDGEYCSLTIHKTGFMGYKLPTSSFRFFYRRTSGRERREAYNYAL